MIDPAAILLNLLLFAAGASIGSFVNVVAYRLPRGLSLVRPRSFCPACGAPIQAWNNIPLLSFAILRARCGKCAARIPLRYPISELGLGLIALYLAWNFSPLDAFARFTLCAALFAVSWIDFDWRLIPDVITLPGIAVGVGAAALVMPDVGLASSLWGVAVGGGFPLAVAEGYARIRGREGLGMGDVKLMAMIGAFLGWQAVLFTALGGSLVGIAAGLSAGLRQRRIPAGAAPQPAPAEETDPARANEAPGLLQTAVPFAPCLSLAAAIFALFQPRLLNWFAG